jgi:hypothetical protein
LSVFLHYSPILCRLHFQRQTEKKLKVVQEIVGEGKGKRSGKVRPDGQTETESGEKKRKKKKEKTEEAQSGQAVDQEVRSGCKRLRSTECIPCNKKFSIHRLVSIMTRTSLSIRLEFSTMFINL